MCTIENCSKSGSARVMSVCVCAKDVASRVKVPLHHRTSYVCTCLVAISVIAQHWNKNTTIVDAFTKFENKHQFSHVHCTMAMPELIWYLFSCYCCLALCACITRFTLNKRHFASFNKSLLFSLAHLLAGVKKRTRQQEFRCNVFHAII